MNVHDLVQLREDIRDCSNCDLRSKATRPVPWSGPTPSKYLFIGMAPGIEEDKRGQPFIGSSGNLLRFLLREAKFPKDIAFANAVCCFPGRIKGGDAKPTKTQLLACRNNLTRQIDVIDPQYIFLVGGTALEAFCPEYSLSQVHGRPLFYDGKDLGHQLKRSITVWTIYHPAAALRSKKYESMIRDDLAAFWRWIRANKPWPEDCGICGKDVTYYDAWGFAYCQLHAMRQQQLALP